MDGMSLLPRCICDPYEAMVGRYDERCSRHAWARKWLAEREAQRAAQPTASEYRPVHGGYPPPYSSTVPPGVLAAAPDPQAAYIGSPDWLRLAQECGGTVYRNRASPHEPAVAFGDESWARFTAALAAIAGSSTAAGVPSISKTSDGTRNEGGQHG